MENNLYSGCFKSNLLKKLMGLRVDNKTVKSLIGNANIHKIQEALIDDANNLRDCIHVGFHLEDRC